MEDNRELDHIMKHIGIIPDMEAKEKAKAAFLLKAEEAMEIEREQRFFKNRNIAYSFLLGMAAMLILVVGFMSVLNPEFLSGAVGTSDYYEINSPYAPFKNGDVLTANKIQKMKASGNKFKLYMENGLVLYVDTLGNGPVSLCYDLMPDAVFADLFKNLAGSSILTLRVEEGFTGIPVKYEIDLTSGVLDGMSSAEQQKWLSGMYVYCYIVDRDQFLKYKEEGRGDTILSKKRRLPAKIDRQSLYVNTDPNLFHNDKDMLIFTLRELDTKLLIK